MFGQTITDDNVTFNKTKTGFLVITVIYGICCGILYICMPFLVDLMAQNQDLGIETTEYVRIEIFSFFLDSLNEFIVIPIKLRKMNSAIVSCLFVKFALTIILDLTFLSNLGFSLNLGINGVAYSSIITSFVTIVINISFLVRAYKPAWQQFQEN